MKATFIIPTIGRETLGRALASVAQQTCGDWNALVIGDRVSEFPKTDQNEKFFFCNLNEKRGRDNCGGLVRNHGLSHAIGEWAAFVDDDDRLDEHYLEWLLDEGKEADLVVFKMRMADGEVIPRTPVIDRGNIGISFAVRISFQRGNNLWFPNDSFEDWVLANNMRLWGGRVKFSEHIAYYVRH